MIYMWSWSSFSLNAFVALHLPRLNFICHYMGWSFYLLRSSLSSSPSALIFATNNSVLSLKFVTSLLTSSCSSPLWFSSAANLSALSFLSPLQGLTVSFRFLHLGPSSFTFVVCSLHHPEKPYSFLVLADATSTLLCQMVVIVAELYQTFGVRREAVPAARSVVREKGQQDRMLLPGNWSNT